MFDQMMRLVVFGTAGEKPWGQLEKVKFLCPAPGYDRHFSVTETLGFELIKMCIRDSINSLVGKACTKTGNKPGVTKGKQWIKLNKNIELLDTPGILWPKFEDQQVGLRLALIGSIRDEILNQDEMAIELIEYLKNHYQGILADRYQVDENEDKVKILEQIALNRNCKMKGNELDYEKASKIVLEEFRNGKLGKISLETPEEGTKAVSYTHLIMTIRGTGKSESSI